ncbi:hypothetical protein JZ751_007023 [Albula glossodonta]|uniref:Ig-like domain-containing protein n=1 Tax=Albula glossodonta TaxID=121402 RepID=A0A8T2P317_9TELE|nr:hypothetical protein JZ751_007023 [Albula glossodonta]
MVSLLAPSDVKLMERAVLHILSLYICAQHVVAQTSFKEFRTVGETIFLHPASRNSNIKDSRWRKSNILIGKPNNMRNVNKYHIFMNGSLLLKTAIKNDSGNYTVELYNHSGHLLSKTDFELIIMEPVSQPEIRMSCTIDGQVMLTCSVNRGDKVELQWIGPVNMSQQAKQSSTEQTLYLISNTSENITCVAKNPVSKEFSKPIGKRCRDAEENIYITMQGCDEMKARGQEKDGSEVDDSLYVTCRSLHPSPYKSRDKGTEETEVMSYDI